MKEKSFFHSTRGVASFVICLIARNDSQIVAGWFVIERHQLRVLPPFSLYVSPKWLASCLDTELFQQIQPVQVECSTHVLAPISARRAASRSIAYVRK